MIKIGNNVFEVPAPSGMKSFALQQRILPVAGRVASVFIQLLGASKVSDINDVLAADVLKVVPMALPAVGEVFSSMPPGELEAITRELLAQATCDRLPLFGSQKGDAFDALMQGRTMDTWKLLWHALEVWYPDFFGRAAKFLGGVKKESLSTESTT
jgi:Phage tail assembly chaperone protein, TAC